MTVPIIQNLSGQGKKEPKPKSKPSSLKAPQKGKQKSQATLKKKNDVKTAKKKTNKGKQKVGLKDHKGKGKAS